MKVHVLSKNEFIDLMKKNNITDDNVEDKSSVMFITIDGTSQHSDRPPHTYFKRDHPNVKVMVFDDIENELAGFKAFSAEMAKGLFKFIKANRDKRTCVVHCAAGISRSGAVGSFVQGYCGGDFEEFMRTNPHILPNGRVLRMLNKEKYNDKG